MAVWGGLTNSSEKKGSEKQRGKGNIAHLNADFQRIARRDKKASVINGKQQRKTIKWKRLEISSRKLEIPTFHAKMGTKKDRNGMDLTEAEEIKIWHRRIIQKRSS